MDKGYRIESRVASGEFAHEAARISLIPKVEGLIFPFTAFPQSHTIGTTT